MLVGCCSVLYRMILKIGKSWDFLQVPEDVPSVTNWGRLFGRMHEVPREQQQWWPTVLDHDSTGPTVRRYNSQPWTEWTPWLLSVAKDECGSERRMQSIYRLEIRQFSLRKFWIWRNTYSRRRRMSTHCSYRPSVLHIPTESVSLFRASFLHKTLKQNCEGLYAAIFEIFRARQLRCQGLCFWPVF